MTKLSIPQEAKIWNPSLQKWENVSPDALATSKVTFDFEFSNWHNGDKRWISMIFYTHFILQ